MPIPDFQTCMLPLLTFANDGTEHPVREAIDILADQFRLSASERSELLPSGQSLLFYNRVGWTKFHLKKAGLIEDTKRGFFKITERGRSVLAEKPIRIDMKFLSRFSEYVDFKDSSKNNTESTDTTMELTIRTPEEVLESAYLKIRQVLAQEIQARILGCSPVFFEHLVVELLVKMGYGGSRKDAGERIGRSGDGGIDGIIKEDRLGLDTIYLQAKRWQGSVGRPEIQKFVGALQGQRANKGVFITTSVFTADATDYVAQIGTKVVLIDGNQLANLMIDFDVGVSVSASFLVKRIDSDYFEES